MTQEQTTERASATVPVKPTDAMLWAGYQADAGCERTFEEFMALCPGWRQDISAIWEAMVKAA